MRHVDWDAEMAAIAPSAPYEFRRAIAMARRTAREQGRRQRVRGYRIGREPWYWTWAPYAPESSRAAAPEGCTICGMVGVIGIKCKGSYHLREQDRLDPQHIWWPGTSALD